MWLSRRRCRAPVSCIEASVRGEVRRDRVPSGYHSSRNCFPELLPGESTSRVRSPGSRTGRAVRLSSFFWSSLLHALWHISLFKSCHRRLPCFVSPVSVVPSSPPGFPPGPSRASSTLASLCSGRDGESHHGALPVLRFPQFRSGGAVHGEETGARLDPQLPARLPHLGDSHP